ncbi:MAG: hypothetical protein ABIJ09_16570 [Pseudomonadota bacterium]
MRLMDVAFGLLALTVPLLGCPEEAIVPSGSDGGARGVLILGDGAVLLGDGAVVPVDGGYDLGDGAMVLPDGAVVPVPDAGVATGDAGPALATCDDTAAGLAGCQCSDGIDQPCDGHPNGDGFIDEYDIFCAGPFDNDECSWATGIPGDNRSASHGDRECFFDGNSGLGNDDECFMFVPPGCDCYGCCAFDINGDDVKEEVRLGGACERFVVTGTPQAGQLGGACLGGGTCSGTLLCVTDTGGGSFCAPCEPCANFGGTQCNETTGEGCCWNVCDEAAGEICFGDEPPPLSPYDAGSSVTDSSTATGTDSGSSTVHDGSSSSSDAATTTRDASTTGNDASWPGDPRCSDLPYCGPDGPCPTGTFCYFACCYPLPG